MPRNFHSGVSLAAALIVVATTAIAFADTVPAFDVVLACRRAGEAAVAPGRTSEGCQNDENRAKETLQKQWGDFADADRARCTRVSGMGGPSSYVELLTCLDMAKTARALPKGDALEVPAASR